MLRGRLHLDIRARAPDPGSRVYVSVFITPPTKAMTPATKAVVNSPFTTGFPVH